HGRRAKLRCEIDQVVDAHTLAKQWRWLCGERLRRARLLAWNVGLRHRLLLDRPHRLPVSPVEDVQESLFAGDEHRLDSTTVDGAHLQQTGILVRLRPD